MAETAGRNRLLFISNGHGEDSIGAEIARRLPPEIVAEAYPTLGDGRAYAGLCPLVGPRAELASQGGRNVTGSFLRDVRGGGIATVLPGLRFARRVRHRYDRIVVVGDMVGIAGGFVAGLSGVLYLDVYKTGCARLYSPAERWLLRRVARTVFCRSDRLAEQLRVDGIDARCAGNVMMDTIVRGDYGAAARRTRPTAVTLLPGSRQRALDSLALQAAALRRLAPGERPDIFLAAAGSLPLAALAAAAGLSLSPPASGEAGDAGTLTGDLVIHVGRGVAGNLMEAADVVLSQAGTASVQALGLGKPVLTFEQPGDKAARTRDESLLFGEAREMLPSDPGQVAEALRRLLADPAERARRGAIGRMRIGGPGAIAAIIEAIAG